MMLIELKLCLESDALNALSACDLARLTDNVDLPQARDSIQISVEFAHGQSDPTRYLSNGAKSGRRALVLVSPKLVESTKDGCKSSDLAQQILETSWQQQIVVGLVGITDLPNDGAVGLDAVIAPQRIKHELCTVLQRLAYRLWFKLAPPRETQRTPSKKPKLQVQRVRDQAHFRECLALRHLVYSSLGYLEADVAGSKIKLDLDCYDTHARQFMVIDQAANQVAGAARLISPGTSPMQRGFDQTRRYEEWCTAFAREEPGRVYRNLLKRRHLASLPIVDSFDYFRDLNDNPTYYPQHACEVSRVVVHPDYRGQGILRLLMQRVIKEAHKHRKRHLMLECAPFHEAMYRKFGFVTLTKDGRCYYMRAQRLDSWAVAMHLDLDGEDRTTAGSSVFHMSIESPLERPLDVEITDPKLDEQAIEDCLRKPFVPPTQRRPVADRVSKSGQSPLLAHLRLGLMRRSDEGLREVIRELHVRLPNANVRLLSGNRVLQMGHPTCRGDDACGSVLHQLNDWLENRHGPA